MSLPKYEKYKRTGVSWLENVPAHWQVLRLKYICLVFPSNVDKHFRDDEPRVQLCNYTDVYHNEQITADMPFMEASASADQVAKFTLKAGDTIITKDSETADDIAIAAYVPKDIPGVICGYHLSMIRPYVGTSGAFVKRLFDSLYVKARFAVAANGLTRVGLGQYALNNVELPFPPIDEQIAIAAFLDRETAKIDALIEEQEKLIVLLVEKRYATLSQTVTKGLNPLSPTRDSGLACLGKIPAHWKMTRLKFVASVQTGIAKGKDTVGKRTINVPYLRVANVQDGFLSLNVIATIDIEAEQLDRYRLLPGDVLMNEGGDFDKLGRGAIWRGEVTDCIHQNHVFAVRPHGVSAEWLNRITSSQYAQFYFMGRSKQSTNLASISSTNIMELPIVLPPKSEQEAILEFVDLETTRLDTLMNKSQHAISLLMERRSALIAAAVAGQIDVRQA
jgi:type I restriction enzyme S subunit